MEGSALEGKFMGETKLKCYLAGAIRTIDDYKWRYEVTETFGANLICFTPPDILSEKPNDHTLLTGADWFKQQAFRPKNFMTQRTDLFLIDQSDLIIANLSALAEGYPCIGTLVEMGYARGKNKFILAVAPPDIKRHPFIAFTADGAFNSMPELMEYLGHIINTTSGQSEIYTRILKNNGRCIR